MSTFLSDDQLFNLAKKLTDDTYDTDSEYDSDCDSEVEDKECPHSNKINQEDGMCICTDCGLVLDNKSYEQEYRYYGHTDSRYQTNPSRCNNKKSEEKSILQEIEAYGFPTSIASEAERIFRDIVKTDIHRGASRKSYIFTSINHAYQRLGQSKDAFWIASKLNIKRKDMSKGEQKYNSIFKDKTNLKEIESFPTDGSIDKCELEILFLGVKENKIKPKEPMKNMAILNEYRNYKEYWKKTKNKKYIEAIDLVPDIIKEVKEKCGIEVDMEVSKRIYDILKCNSDIVDKHLPQNIAAGIVFYQIIQRYPIRKKTFREQIKNLSEITIDKIVERISNIMNAYSKEQIGL